MNHLRIIIVEDEALVARDLQTTLVRLGYAVVNVVSSGAEAIAAVQASKPDLALMSVGLTHDESGTSMARILQQEHDVPVVIISAHGDPRTVKQACDSQPFGYLLKPFHESELRTVVELAVARHQAQQQLISHQSHLTATLRSLPEAVLATDLLGHVTFMNAHAERLTGWTLTEALNRPLNEIMVLSHDAGDAVEPYSGGSTSGRRIILTKRDKTLEYIEDTTAPIREPDGSLAGIVVLFRQRTQSSAEAKTAALEQAASNPNLANMVHSLTDPLISMDADWQITYINEPAAAVLQSSRELLLGTSLWDHLPPSVHQRYYHEFSQALAKSSTRTFEMELEPAQRWFEVQLNPFGSGLLALGRDITVRKHAEEKERKLEKLESLGLLARGFAHDFNNLLTVLLGNISLAEMQSPEEAPGHSELLIAKQATLQAQGLVQHLLIFARGGVPVKQVTDFGRFVKDWVQEWPRVEGITYNVDISPSLKPADVDRQQFSRLLHNIFRNAEQAMRKGGTISLALKPSEQEDSIVLELSDTGCGIPQDALRMVFEPYFTTRDEDHATGLGLTVCESIAKAHGAQLNVTSTLGEGTTVHLTLPAHKPPVIEIRPDRLDVEVSRPSKAAGPRRVLILEDEPLIRQLMSATLKSIGCEVDQTIDGADTIARYADAMEKGSPYQLLIMDLSIPNGMGGLQAMDQILQKDPQARAIVSSGYCDDPVLSRYLDYGFRAVLPKPYQPQDLQQMVETMLQE